MTLDEAIKRNKELWLPIKTEEDHKNHEAIRLGIEALKGIKAIRCGAISDVKQPLPGETEE